MKYEDEFVAWVLETWNIGNSNTVYAYLVDGVSYKAFLSDMGLKDE